MMALPDIHPEHLFDRVLSGRASEAERAELDTHMRTCAGCAAEWQLALVLRARVDGAAAEPVSSAAVDAVIAVLAREGRVGASDAQPKKAPTGRGWMPWAVAACLFFTGSAAAASLIVAVRLNSTPPAQSKPVQAEPPRAAAHPVRAKHADETAAPVEAPAQPPPLQAVPERPRTRSAAVQKAQPSADELFAQARAAAMRGEHAAAAELYTTLEQRFAASDQAHVARVLLGRLYLERLGDARAALAQFDAYLKQGGANRPEALLGRARALRKLGREREEIATLRELVDAYPDSLYVAPAEERLRSVE
jgi:TolA-binding protein